MMRLLDGRRAVALAVLLFLAGCAKPPMSLPGPIEFQRSPRSAGTEITAGAPAPTRPPQTTVAVMPSAPGAAQVAAAVPPATPASAGAEPADVSMAIEQTPLPMFIQILYGNVLKRPFSMDPAVSARPDIVTFKTSQPITRSRMEQLAVQLLQSYQVTVQDLDGLIRLVPANSPSAVPPPVLRFGKTLPQTPDALRTAFHYVEIDVVKTSDISQVLRQVLGARVNLQEDASRSGLLMSGTQADLRTALELIQSLDQPRMKGRIARRITPAFLNASEFSGRLSDMLTAQGFAVSTSPSGNTPILLVPIPVIGSVMVFANSEASMEHVLRWASELDRPVSAQTQNGLFTYAVKFADAQDLAKTLGDILGSPVAAPVAAQQPGAQSAFGAGGTAANNSFGASTARTGSGGRVVVNSATNTLIIRGTNADEYQQLMSLLRELDRPVKSALIEVVVAELRLGGTQTLGIDWNVPSRSVNGGQNLVAGGTLGGVGIGSGGFNLSIGNSVGTLLARLNALALDDRARVLSNPKVLARNGETASIQVGAEVPIITSQQSTGTTSGGLFGSTAGVLQQITYRSTGVILRVRPVINSGNRLDLDLSQEVSSAAQTSTGVGASPTISTRRIETKLSLRDGSTVLLGGLISRNQSDSNVGVPFLKDIPGLGSFFRSASNQNDQTELLIMITPYVVSDDFESEAITEAIQNSFGDWARHIKPSRVMQQPSPTAPEGPGAMSVPAPSVPAASVTPPSRAGSLSTTIPAPIQPLNAPAQDLPLPPGGAAAAAPQAPQLSAPGSSGPGSTTTADGVTTSRGAPVPQGSNPSVSSEGAPAPKPPSVSPEAKPAPSASPPNTTPPPPFVGKPVTDPQIKKELEEFLKNTPRPR